MKKNMRKFKKNVLKFRWKYSYYFWPIYIYIYIYIKKNKSIKQLLMVTRGLGVLLSFSLEKPRQVDN
jgi:hypothetical protein